MNILFYCDEYPPYKHGGIGTVTRITAESLVKRGHTVYVVGLYVFTDEPFYQEINGVHIYRFKQHPILKFIPSFLHSKFLALFQKTRIAANAALVKFKQTEAFIDELVKEKRINVIEFPDFINSFIFIKHSLVLQNYSIPLVIRTHGSWSYLNYYSSKLGENEILFENERNHINRADYILPLSEFAQEFILSKFRIKKDGAIIPNMIEDRLIKVPSDSSSQSKDKYILYFGKIVETKGVFNLIRGFVSVAKQYPDVKLLLIGNGDIDEAKKLIPETLRKNIILKGFVSRNDIFRYIDESYACVLPSYFEAFSLAVLEVLARGKALISTQEGTGKEVITDMENGLLVDPYSPESIAEAILRLLGDKDLTAHLGVRGLQLIEEEYKESVVIDKLETFYLSLKK